MNKYIYYVLVLSLVASCTDPKLKLEKKIKRLEHGATSPSALDSLYTYYIEYATRYPKEAKSSYYLNYAAMQAGLKKDNVTAKSLSFMYVKNYPAGAELPSTYQNLAKIYQIENRFDSAIYYFLESGKLRPLSVADQLDLALSYQKNAEKAQNNQQASTDSKKAAYIYQTVAAYNDAIASHKFSIFKEPKNPKNASSLQTIAFLYENELNLLDSAKIYYARLRSEFPDTEEGKQAAYLIDNKLIGKSAEEILEFGKKNLP